MKVNVAADGNVPEHFWKILLLVVASCVGGIHSDSILLMMGV
jgi:hypothetical protein